MGCANILHHFFIRRDKDVVAVVSDELGTKRTCPSCGARFYGLLKDPIVCPKCEHSFVVEQLLPSKADLPTRAKPADKPADEEEAKKDEGELEEDAVVVSLEDLEDDTDDSDDEAAAIKDVDLGETDDEGDTDDSDVFLDDEEDENAPGVEDLIGGGPKTSGDEV